VQVANVDRTIYVYEIGYRLHSLGSQVLNSGAYASFRVGRYHE